MKTSALCLRDDIIFVGCPKVGVLVAPVGLNGSFIPVRTLPFNDANPLRSAVMSPSLSGDFSRCKLPSLGVVDCSGAFGGARSLTMLPISRRAVVSRRGLFLRGDCKDAKSGSSLDEMVLRCGLNVNLAPGLELS